MPSTPIKLSPSDLTFLWDECPRCFYLKYIHGISRPAAPFPSIFGTIDRLMKAHYAGRPSSDLDPSLPPGIVSVSEQWIESIPVTLPGHSLSCFLRGKFDALIGFDDGSHGVIDFKTSEPKPAHIPFYSRQLHAYAYALEHPAPGKLYLSPISRLGLFVATPRATLNNTTSEISFQIALTWLEVPFQESGFLSFLDLVLTLLELPEPPPAGEKCTFCQYRQHAREHGM
jgi:hypothetical protein